VAEQFGPYRLDEVIGRGGMGEVYRAHDTVKNRTVAVKRLPPALAADAEFRTRFRREAEIAARLSEPHIVPIHDFGEIDGHLFLDMRLVRGRDLATLLREDGPLPPEQAVAVVGQVASALAAAHAEELVHRDVKPSNVLVTADDFVYLVDFGIARTATATALTATGATIGTFGYMAPERLLTGRCDHRADIYALGCLLYESLTASKPFPGEDIEPQTYHHVHTPPPTGLPGGLDAVVAKAMAKDPEDRYPTALTFAIASRKARTPVPTTTLAAHSPTTITNKSRTATTTPVDLNLLAKLPAAVTPFLLFTKWWQSALWGAPSGAMTVSSAAAAAAAGVSLFEDKPPAYLNPPILISVGLVGAIIGTVLSLLGSWSRRSFLRSAGQASTVHWINGARLALRGPIPSDSQLRKIAYRLAERQLVHVREARTLAPVIWSIILGLDVYLARVVESKVFWLYTGSPCLILIYFLLEPARLQRRVNLLRPDEE
jgi:serine/threonine protein kinase